MFCVCIGRNVVAKVVDKTLAIAFGKMLTQRHIHDVLVVDAEANVLYYARF